MMSSKPIPIPQCNRKADHHRDDDVTAHEAQMYEAATWRMYDLICRSRLIRAAHFMDHPQPQAYLVGRPSQHHVVLTQDNDHTTALPRQKLDDAHQDRAHSLLEPLSMPCRSSVVMDEVFIMD
mmetsp:Transcript_11703/g.20012  ORF Transcript_11703/g.20012 Transcript_11703/m.20012 type:complete len:123 (-) Transcript_11703:164-532(-)